MIDVDELGITKEGIANQQIGKEVEGERVNEPGLDGHGQKWTGWMAVAGREGGDTPDRWLDFDQNPGTDVVTF